MKFDILVESLLNKNLNLISLNQLYDYDLPSNDEMIWNFVNHNEFDVQIPIENISNQEIKNLLLKTYNKKSISDINKLLKPQQKKIINHYRKIPSNDPIVICNNIILDGNHRALANFLEKKPITVVNLEKIDKFK